MSSELTIRIILKRPTAAVDFGIQRGKGSNYETVLKQRSAGNDLHFEFAITVKTQKSGQYDFFGPFVHGPTNERFIYIDIGAAAGQRDAIWSRRLKIPLRGITQPMINNLLTDNKMILETTVEGKGKDGSPACATPKPFNGWHLVLA